MPRKLWEHPNPKETAMGQFMEDCNRRFGLKMQVSLVIYPPHPQTVCPNCLLTASPTVDL